MSEDNTPWRPVPEADLEWDVSGAPRSRNFQDIYYSVEDGQQESRFVFLAGNDLPRRFESHQQRLFTIGETGFGTGLNFLLTWQAWREAPQDKPDLHFISVEMNPLSAANMRRALASWPGLEDLSEQLLAAYPGLLPGSHRLLLDEGRVRLDLHWRECQETLTELAELCPGTFDAWYLDGFAPSRNESMWKAEVCNAMGRLSRPGASFATFTAAGQVRRDLLGAGFEVKKTPGFGRKRERLVGRRSSQALAEPQFRQTPWDLPDARLDPTAEVMVIGAGLAGCTAAHALARRGLKVTVLERSAIAGAASGNEQGVLYTRLSRQHSPLTDFALHSFFHAQHFYRQLFSTGRLISGQDGQLCGNLQLSSKERDLEYLGPLLEQVPQLASVVGREQASSLAGLELPSGGYWMPGSGWLRPPAVCGALLQHDNIRSLQHTGEITLSRADGQWTASAGSQTMASAPCTVLAPGADCHEIPELSWLPLQLIRGQTSHIPATALPQAPLTTLCSEGYIAPPRAGSYCTGASFIIDDCSLELRQSEHRQNLDKLARAIPAWADDIAQLDTATLQGRVGVRCNSTDYLPIAGPVPELEPFEERFSGLRKNARQLIVSKGCYLPGLYVSTAHGSRGLTSAPLCAELLASQICQEPPPLSRRLARAVAPARFIIRNLSRNRT